MDIHWDGLSELSEAQRDAAEQRLRRIGTQHDDLLWVRITGRETAHHRHGAREVHIAATTKGREIAASRTRPDLAKALHDALDAFEHEMRRLRDRRRPRPRARAQAPAVLGLVDRIAREEGYGFALADDGTRVYFHRNAVSGGLSFDELDVGQRVALSIEGGEEGPQASVVAPAPADAPSP